MIFFDIIMNISLVFLNLLFMDSACGLLLMKLASEKTIFGCNFLYNLFKMLFVRSALFYGWFHPNKSAQRAASIKQSPTVILSPTEKTCHNSIPSFKFLSDSIKIISKNTISHKKRWIFLFKTCELPTGFFHLPNY